MQKVLFFMLGFLLLLFTAGSVNATPINVSQGGIFLGTIDPYIGSLSSFANYNYYSSSNHVVNGPTAVNQQAQVFFYDGSDGLSFNMVFGSVGGGSNGKVNWDLSITGSSTDPGVLVSDDSNELKEILNTNNFQARFAYLQSYGDGGVIGMLGSNSWTLTIDPLLYQNVPTFLAYGSNGSINLELDLNKDIVFTQGSSPVPEPATMILFGLGLLGLAGMGRKNN